MPRALCRTGNFGSEYHALSSWPLCLIYAFPMKVKTRLSVRLPGVLTSSVG
jgi:hypothetical protein